MQSTYRLLAQFADAEAAGEVASATPSTIVVNGPTDVTITIQITDPRLVAGSVTLQQLDANGAVVAGLGMLTDDGVNGDAVAGDKTFTTRQSFTETTPTPVKLRISWILQAKNKQTTASSKVTIKVVRIDPATACVCSSDGNQPILRR